MVLSVSLAGYKKAKKKIFLKKKLKKNFEKKVKKKKILIRLDIYY